MNKRNLKKILPAILIVLSVAAIACSLDRYICMPWHMGIKLDAPLSVTADKEKAVICENGGGRIIILDDKDRVVNVLSKGLMKSSLIYSPYAAICGESLYLTCGECIGNSVTFKSEEIVRYSDEGKDPVTVFRFRNGQSDNSRCRVRILAVFERKGRCYAGVIDDDESSIAVVMLPKKGNAMLGAKDLHFDKRADKDVSFSCIWYDSKRDRIFAADQFGDVYSWGFFEKGISGKGSGTLSEGFYSAYYPKYQDMIIQKKGISEKGISFSDGRFDFKENVPAEIKEYRGRTVYNTPLLQMRIWMFWLGVICLLFVTIFFLIRANKSMFSAGKRRELKRTGGAFVLVLCCLAVVVFYSVEFISTTAANDIAEQRTMVRVLHDNSKDLIYKASGEFEKNSRVSRGTYDRLMTLLENASLAGSKEKRGSGYILTLNSEGKMHQILYTSFTVVSGMLSRELDHQEDQKDGKVFSYQSISAAGYYSSSRITYTDDEGHLIGYLYASEDADVLTASYLKKCAEMFIKLFVGILVILYALMEAKNWVSGFRRRKILKSQGLDFQGVSFTRPMGFLVFSATSADSALVVLIVKDIIEGTPYEGNLIICSLPITIMAVGFFTGDVLANFLLSRYTAKKVLLSSSVLSVAALLAVSYGVYTERLVIMLVSLMVAYMLLEISMFYVLGYASAAPNDNLRKTCNHDISACKISSYALITIPAGYACSMFGNFAVYITAIVPAVLFMILVILNPVDDRKVCGPADKKMKEGIRQRLKFLLSPRILILLFCGIGAVQVLGGYKSYVFPLFADEGGISKAVISNIQVFAKAVVFFSLPLIRRYEERVGESNVIAINNLVMAGVFFMFYISPNVTWATFALILTYLATKGMDPSIAFIWQKYAEKKGTDMRMAQSVMKNAENTVDMLKAPVLGTFLGFGQIISCMIIGGYMAVSSGIVKAILKRTKN